MNVTDGEFRNGFEVEGNRAAFLHRYELVTGMVGIYMVSQIKRVQPPCPASWLCKPVKDAFASFASRRSC